MREGFQDWVAFEKKPLDTLHQVDVAMNFFFVQLFEDGFCPGEGSYTLAAWLLLMKLEDRASQLLPLSRKALAGWRRRQPGRVRDPAPSILLMLFAHYFLDLGGEMAAACVAFQLDTYLRSGVAVEFTADRVIPPATKAGRKYGRRWAIVPARSDLQQTTKTGTSDEALLVGDVTRHWVSDVVSRLRLAAAPDGRLFGQLTLARYEDLFRKASEHFKVRHMNVVPHTVRHSGPASEDILNKVRTLAGVKRRGDWSCDKSVKRYEKHAKILLQLQRMPPELQLRAANAERSLPARLLAVL